jgi:hypothetical protein
MTRDRIRIGGASGFWGDSSIALPQLLEGGCLDYVVFDYLAEITMSIMARARARDPNAGYATDFVALLGSHLKTLADKKIRVISNAGGVNPRACARRLEEAIQQAGLSLKVGVVEGDDVRSQLEAMRAHGVLDMFGAMPLPQELLSANAYLGAFPIAAALDAGADIVITGRCVDSAVTLAACLHEFGWSSTDFDRLASGSLAGHILECGAQATGGLHTDWERTGCWSNIGYPIAEIRAEGSFDISKPPGTGGLVTFGTVAEQLVYEIGDPAAYLLPDVTCDFSLVAIEEIGPDLVRVTNAKGGRAPDSYKVSATFQDGYRVGMYLTIIGIDAARKARQVGESVERRCSELLRARGFAPYDEVSIEVVGAESAYGPHSRAQASREVILKIAAKHRVAAALELLVRELTSSGTSMSPGITTMGGNRPKVSPLVRLFSCLLPKSQVTPSIEVAGSSVSWTAEQPGDAVDPPTASDACMVPSESLGTECTVPLIELAWARSGDKGNDANIGVIARKPEYIPYIRRALTDAAVARYFAHVLPREVKRYELPGIGGFNFLLKDALGGGGIASLRNDPQGKGFAQILLDYPVPIAAALEADLHRPGQAVPAAVQA